MNRKVLLTAALSRLIDLHDTRHTPGQDPKTVIQSKAAYENAAFHLSLGLSILEALNELGKEAGLDTFQSKARISEVVAEIDREYDPNDIEFCIKLLSTPREIRFTSDEGRESSTSETTILIERSVGEVDQYRLTKSAHLFFKISEHKDNWIYEGDNARKMVRAMEYGFFEDIPQLCRDRITDLLLFCRMITRAKERAAFDEAVKDFFETWEAHKKSLDDARSAVRECWSLISGAAFTQKFEEWQTRTGRRDITPGQLMTYFEKVAQMNETASRQLLDFVNNIMQYKASAVGLVDFKERAAAIAQEGATCDLMMSFIRTVMPAVPKDCYFHPLDWVESIELDKAEAEVNTFVVDTTQEDYGAVEERFSDYLHRNIGWIADLLAKGPIPFSRILEEGEFSLREGESPAMLHGFCASPETFRELGVSIVVKFSGDRFAKRLGNRVIHGDDLELCLGG